MKTRLRRMTLLWSVLLCVLLAAITASAANLGTLYSNGPSSPTDNYAWQINFGYIVSNSFTLGAASTVTGFSFGVWAYPGDRPLTVDWSITSAEFGGTTYGAGTANVSASFLWTNNTNPTLCPAGSCDVLQLTTGAMSPVAMAPGTYWLNLQNITSVQGSPVMWEENNGLGCAPTDPAYWCTSKASESTVGTMASEDPEIYGYSEGGGGGTPEPSSMVLFASGVLGLGATLRRQLRG